MVYHTIRLAYSIIAASAWAVECACNAARDSCCTIAHVSYRVLAAGKYIMQFCRWKELFLSTVRPVCRICTRMRIAISTAPRRPQMHPTQSNDQSSRFLRRGALCCSLVFIITLLCPNWPIIFVIVSLFFPSLGNEYWFLPRAAFNKQTISYSYLQACVLYFHQIFHRALHVVEITLLMRKKTFSFASFFVIYLLVIHYKHASRHREFFLIDNTGKMYKKNLSTQINVSNFFVFAIKRYSNLLLPTNCDLQSITSIIHWNQFIMLSNLRSR